MRIPKVPCRTPYVGFPSKSRKRTVTMKVGAGDDEAVFDVPATTMRQVSGYFFDK